MTEPASPTQESSTPFRFRLRPRRGVFHRVEPEPVSGVEFFEELDLVYRTLCAVLFNYVPTSGHPGGSVSSGRFVEGLLFEHMGYDFSAPDLPEADQICYAAGHKALGLYSMWALRNELARIGDPGLLPAEGRQLRFEDLLGFRRNPTNRTPLFRKFKSKVLDGHPTPAMPFVPVATGASGVGLTAALGLALGALDAYGRRCPRVHIVEGEGGMTPGRVQEGLAAAATMGLENAFLHLDWNQATIDSEQACPEHGKPGDYVQWNPLELLRLHDWNVFFAGDGHDFKHVLTAQRMALAVNNGQPTAVVYRTVKGWNYGIEGRKCHGAGHAFCSEGYYKAVAPFEAHYGVKLPRLEGDPVPDNIEKAYWETLLAVRKALESKPGLAKAAVKRLRAAAERTKKAGCVPRAEGPRLDLLYSSNFTPDKVPPQICLTPGKKETLRGALGQSLGYLNRWTNGAFLACAADLLESTSVSAVNNGFSAGYFHSWSNPGSRLLSIGGICEDAMGGMMAGLAAYGRHIGVSSSYAAFIAPLQHIPARLHAIGQMARRSVAGEPYRPFVMVNAHAGPMTGEDGPTHADPQALQLLQDNFPLGTLVTLTPWEPQEVWPLLIAALNVRPAVICPFVTRPPVLVPDRQAMGLPAAYAAAKGLYAMRRSSKKATVVLQGAGVASLFAHEVLPQLEKRGVQLNVFYVASSELFDLLPEEEKDSLYPADLARNAMGITEFTLPTIRRWLLSDEGVRRTLHPFRKGHFLGSGSWDRVLEEGGLDAAAQLETVVEWARRIDG
jgi:transketolase